MGSYGRALLLQACISCPLMCAQRLSVTLVRSAEDVLATCYLTCGKIAPDFEQLELSVGESTVAAAVVETTGKPHLQLALLTDNRRSILRPVDVAGCEHCRVLLHACSLRNR